MRAEPDYNIMASEEHGGPPRLKPHERKSEKWTPWGMVQNGGEREAWPAPNMDLIDGGIRPAPKFPLELLPEAFARACADLAASKGCPVDYMIGSNLAVAASLVGNARNFEAWPGWSEPAALWAMNVGHPSDGKSQGTTPALTLASELEAAGLDAFKEKQRRHAAAVEEARLHLESWKKDCETAHERNAPAPIMPEKALEPQEPGRPRVVAMDSTQEALAAIIAANPKGVCLFRDELSGLISERYGDHTQRAFYLEAYGAGPYTIDRKKTKEPIRIERLTLSIVGGIQPDKLNSLLFQSDDDGLASRFLPFWPERRAPVRPTNGYDLDALRYAFARLHALQLAETPEGLKPVLMRLAPEAADAHHTGREALYHNENDSSGMFASFVGKLPGMALRLSGLLELLAYAFGDSEPPPEIVSLKSVNRAWGLTNKYFLPMGQRVYGDAAIPVVERHAGAIARKIMKLRELTIKGRDVYKVWGIPGLRSADKAAPALAYLQEEGWIRPAQSRRDGKPGRHSYFEVNPSVFP